MCIYVEKVKYWQLHNTLLNMIIVEGIQKETQKISSLAIVDHSFYSILLTFFLLHVHFEVVEKKIIIKKGRAKKLFEKKK